MDKSIQIRLALITRGFQQGMQQAASATHGFSQQTQAAATQGLTPLRQRLAAAAGIGLLWLLAQSILGALGG